MENAEIADVLVKIAQLLELKGGEVFRSRAFYNAALSLRAVAPRVEDMVSAGADLTELPHIGEHLARYIAQIVETGTCDRLEQLHREFPQNLAALLDLPQLGPKRVRQLHDALGIDTIADLKAAAERHEIQKLPRMGPKTEQNILKAIEIAEVAQTRVSWATAAEQAHAIGRFLDGIAGIARWEIAGSFRRRTDTVGDLDFLVQADDRMGAIENIRRFPSIESVDRRGPERLTVRLRSGLQIDFRFFAAEAYGAALMYFTGSKAHNIALRNRAKAHKWKLNEYGLFAGDRRLAGATEADIYRTLGLPYIAPELRENRGEIEAAENGKLPELVELADIRGNLHAHTTASDGTASIAEMARAAREMGYEYLAITDHSKAVRIANGLDETRLKRHAARIREVDAAIDGIWILAGVEVDILKNGTLDISPAVLADLDFVVASVHSYFTLDEKQTTERLVRAIQSGVVHCLGHPTGRTIGHRAPISFDADRVFTACRDFGVSLEINAQPMRLDLPDTWCQHAREFGVTFSIATDAHSIADLGRMGLGVGVARRGWVTTAEVINTRPAAEFRQSLPGHRRAA